MTIIATCHCGATRIELPHLPRRQQGMQLQLCPKTGAIWGYYTPEEVTDRLCRP